MPHASERARRWATGLLIVAAVLAVWAAVIALTGGFRIDLGPIRISSRNAVWATLLALVPAVIGWRLAYQPWLEQRVTQWSPRAARLALPAVLVVAAIVLLIGVRYGVRAASASDGSGYVSQSALWVNGNLRIDQSFAARFPWPNAKMTFAPLGYRIGADEAMVPTYAPGVPLLMGVLRLVTPCGPYLVGPLSIALLVVSTFVLGRDLFGTAASFVAAALIACSPLVLLMGLSPMADVPAAAFWIAALAVGLQGRPAAAAAAGVLTAVAIVIRPNLVPLAIFPWLLTVVRAPGLRPLLTRTASFAAGSVPGPLFVAWVNDYLYGSPLTSGYGDLSNAFSIDFALTNIRQYSAWWWESQGPLAFLFVVALFRRRRVFAREAAVVTSFAASVGLLYVFYEPFDAWWFLRFLLPAVPVVFLLCADVVDWAARGSGTVRVAGLAALLLIAGGNAIRFGDVKDVTAIGTGDQRYAEAALHIAEVTPPDAVILTLQHSGSVRYHTGRLILRWDFIEPEWLDAAVAELHTRGVPTYVLLEAWEDPVFRQRFKGQRLLGELDKGADAIGRGGELRFYAIPASGRQVVVEPAVIPARPDPKCLDVAPDYVTPAAVRKFAAAERPAR